MFGDQRKDQFTKDFPSRNSTFFSISSKLHSLFEFRVRNRSANRSEKTRTRRCTRCVRVVSLGGHVWPACAFRKMRTVLSAPRRRASPFFFQMLVRNARESPVFTVCRARFHRAHVKDEDCFDGAYPIDFLFCFPTFKNKLTNFVLRQLLRTW